METDTSVWKRSASLPDLGVFSPGRWLVPVVIWRAERSVAGWEQTVSWKGAINFQAKMQLPTVLHPIHRMLATPPLLASGHLFPKSCSDCPGLSSPPSWRGMLWTQACPGNKVPALAPDRALWLISLPSPPADTAFALQQALHQSVFMPSLSTNPTHRLHLCWEQHCKLLPEVSGLTARNVAKWSVEEVSCASCFSSCLIGRCVNAAAAAAISYACFATVASSGGGRGVLTPARSWAYD